jgi:hypothetical protein
MKRVTCKGGIKFVLDYLYAIFFDLFNGNVTMSCLVWCPTQIKRIEPFPVFRGCLIRAHRAIAESKQRS